MIAAAAVEARFQFAPMGRTRKHIGTVRGLVNKPGWTVIVCRCNWAEIYGPRTKATTAAERFARHVTR